MPDPWLHIIGMGEDSLEGLSDASKQALENADIVFGSPRQLELDDVGEKDKAWPVPFSVQEVLQNKGQKVAVLASGNPFWHGVGGTLAKHLSPEEWVCHPSPSSFSLVAGKLGWKLEETVCLALHAAPQEKIFPELSNGEKLILLVRDKAQILQIAAYLTAEAFGESSFYVLQSLGGAYEKVEKLAASELETASIVYPVTLALSLVGPKGMQQCSGLPDDMFVTDGQMTKRAVRAITLSSLSPRKGETIWDLGAGTGTIGIEWLLSTSSTKSIAVEKDKSRIDHIIANAEKFGVSSRLTVVEGKTEAVLSNLPEPDAVFIGGGLSEDLLKAVWVKMPKHCRLVVNAVTLESESLLQHWSLEKGGELMRIDIAKTKPLGPKRGWQSANPVTQWVVTK
ncbi:MAG: precorrin-6y C5,15-methyltransferase (decarboxylating) subunit CbiE [Sneathiellales bacterium]|nr:precorrin-6y C5,15-methyltransferase (decarboxylating) subunit CbiE [Sneathiellales bacterium]